MNDEFSGLFHIFYTVI